MYNDACLHAADSETSQSVFQFFTLFFKDQVLTSACVKFYSCIRMRVDRFCLALSVLMFGNCRCEVTDADLLTVLNVVAETKGMLHGQCIGLGRIAPCISSLSSLSMQFLSCVSANLFR